MNRQERKIAIFMDGTWNKQDCMVNKEKNTNVVKLYKLVAEKYHGHPEQIALYDPGVGTCGHFIHKILDGLTGKGLSENIEEAYVTLARYFEPGDKIYIFGFSRGAYTARSLAGLIRNCGVLRKETLEKNPHIVHDVYKFYRDRDPAKAPDSYESQKLISDYSYETDIHFLGVWDTVGALGLPLGFLDDEDEGLHRFHDTSLSTHVKNAFQALAMDEFRDEFKPCLWDVNTDDGVQRVEQRWFVGSHSDVGGGYEDDDSLADITLRWMAEKAAESGLKLTLDPRSELRIDEEAYMGPVHDSYEEFYKKPLVRLGKLFKFRDYRPCVRQGNCDIYDLALKRIEEDHNYRPFGRDRADILNRLI